MKTGQMAAAAALAVLAACGTPPPATEPAAAAAVRVTVETLRAETVPETISLTGVVRPRRQATVAAQMMGSVRSVGVEEGQTVAAGQILVQLDDQQSRATVAAALAMRDEADAAIAAGRQAAGAAEAQLALAKATYERYQTLLSKESVSQHEYDVAAAGLQAAEAGLEQARAQTAQAEAKRRQAEAQITSTEVVLGYAEITAPIAGVITQRFVDPGDLANPGRPLFEIEAAGEYRLEAAVPESLISSIQVGQEVDVSIEALGENGPGKGRIAQIDRSATDASRTFLAKIALSPAPGLRSGLYGQALLPSGQRSSLSVPQRAVTTRGQIQAVFTAEDGVAQRRLVTLGELAGGRYEALSGLESGDRVILEPSSVADGVRIEERR